MDWQGRPDDTDPPDYEVLGETYCGIHDEPIDSRYGCRICPREQ